MQSAVEGQIFQHFPLQGSSVPESKEVLAEGFPAFVELLLEFFILDILALHGLPLRDNLNSYLDSELLCDMKSFCQ